MTVEIYVHDKDNESTQCLQLGNFGFVAFKIRLFAILCGQELATKHEEVCDKAFGWSDEEDRLYVDGLYDTVGNEIARLVFLNPDQGKLPRKWCRILFYKLIDKLEEAQKDIVWRSDYQALMNGLAVAGMIEVNGDDIKEITMTEEQEWELGLSTC